MSKPNERSCRILGNSMRPFCPHPCYSQYSGLQNSITFFSTGSLLSLEKYVRQKFLLCLFSKNNLEFVWFPPYYHLFSKNLVFFAQNSVYWWETNKPKHFLKKWNVWVFEMILHTLAVPKASNWNKLWLFKHTPMMGGNGEIFVFFQKK